ncbi:hypothetical protein JCM17960_00440 [Magnetospira thiophila]
MKSHLKFMTLVLVCAALGACTSIKLGYNSPLTPAQDGALPEEATALFGHWTPLSPKHDDFVYVGKMKLIGRDASGSQNERLVIINLDPHKPDGWNVAQGHFSEIEGVHYVNMLLGTSEGTQMWMFAAYEVNGDPPVLSLTPVKSTSMETFEKAGIIGFDKNNEGGAVAEYLRRFGGKGLLHDTPSKFVPTIPPKPEDKH